MGGFGKDVAGWFGMDMDIPKQPEMPAPVEEVDVSGQKQYTKERLKSKKGRQSTILSSLGTQNKGGKTLLG
jgi:hypothetical protein